VQVPTSVTHGQCVILLHYTCMFVLQCCNKLRIYVKYSTFCFNVVLFLLSLSSWVRLAMVTCHIYFVFSFPSSLFSHCVLYQQSPTPSVCCCYSPFSSHYFQISLNAILSSHSQSSSPPSPTFWASALCQCYISHSFHITISALSSPISC